MKLTVKEISETLFVSEEQVRRWCRDKKLKVDEFSSKKEGYIIDDLDFIEFLNKHPKYRKLFDLKGEYAILKISKVYSLEKQITELEKQIGELKQQLTELKGSE